MKKIIVNTDIEVSAFTEGFGATGILIAVQDDDGGHVITLKNGELGGPIVLNTFPRAITLLEWIRDDIEVYWSSKILKPGIRPTVVPTISIDDYYDLLEVYHGYTDEDILMSINNGPWIPYPGPFSIGAVNRPAGYWRFKIIEAPGRIESKIASSLPTFSQKTGFDYTLDLILS